MTKNQRVILSILFEQTSKNQIKVDLVDENFTELKGEIAGPPDTPYEGEKQVWVYFPRMSV